ncbi:hypothetical protein M5689_005228 [Euphorbia peplus]|nr:hypothetical protein M5689_005228 [Euphorbia peplus]
MVNSDYPVYDEFAIPNLSTNFSHSLGEEGSVQVTPFPSQFVSSQKVKDKRTRTKKFTKEEDVMLISAWQNIHLDEITGVNQTHETYWEKVHKYFMKYKDFPSDRNCSSLMHRWSVIQLAVSKFQGFYSQADGRSGYSEDDKIRCAKDMYKNVIKNTFSVEHCWKILRYSPKWNLKFGTDKSNVSYKDDLTAHSPSTAECVRLGNSEFERPTGRKAAKEIQRNRKRLENEHDDDGGAAILEQMRADQLE